MSIVTRVIGYVILALLVAVCAAVCAYIIILLVHGMGVMLWAQ